MVGDFCSLPRRLHGLGIQKGGQRSRYADRKKIFNFKNDDVDNIKIDRPDGSLEITRTKEGWKVVKPYNDLAEPTAVDAILYSLNLQKGKIFRTEDESKPINWKELQLDPPGITVEIKTTKDTQTLGVSNKNAFDGSFYLRKGDELMLADRGMAQAILRDPKTFRSRRLWREADGTIQSVDAEINLDNVKDKFSVSRDGTDWKLSPAPAFPVDKARLEFWVNSLQQINPQEVASETLSEEQKREFLLLKPSFVAHVHFRHDKGDNDEWTLTIGQDKAEDVYLYTNKSPVVYKTTRGSLDTVRIPREFFRDGKKPFQFPVEQARQIEIHDGGFSRTFRKNDLVWKLENPADGETLNQDKLVGLMQKITALEAHEFLPAKTAKGFKPTQQIVVRDDKGKTLFEMSWGDTYKALRTYNKGMTFQFVKTNLETDALGVNNTKLKGLVDHNMIEKAPAADKAKAK